MAIRRRSFDEDRAYTDVVREAVREALGVPLEGADPEARTPRSRT
jgi:hypothetical protein